jgi:thiamine transporter ThiT
MTERGGNMKQNRTQKIVTSGVFLALALILPFFTGNIPQIGNAISPMHIPVLILGFIAGWPYGLLVGFIAPLLRSALFSMPPMYPVAIAMAFELAAYGFFTGLLYKKLPKTTGNLYLTLIASMLLGRVVWGVVRFALATVSQTAFTFSMFIAGAFLNAIPGIIIHIILVPIIVLAFQRAGFLDHE